MEQNAQTSKKVKCASLANLNTNCKRDIALATIAKHFYSNKKGTNKISIPSNSDTYKTNDASYCQQFGTFSLTEIILDLHSLSDYC